MVWDKSETSTDNSVTDARHVQQAGRDVIIDGMRPELHKDMLEKALADLRRDLEEKHAQARRADAAELKMRQMEVDSLNTQIAEYQRKLAEPEKAFEEDAARVRDIAQRLDREANHLGAEKIDAAKAALARFDYRLADALFDEVKGIEALALQRYARAEYGQGEIAEAEVRWHDAAARYARAAEIAPDFDSLKKAAEFAHRAGQYTEAARWSARLLDGTGDAEPEDRSTALNDHATNLWALGRYAEAEPLFRQALQIGKDTLGPAQPDYATRLNNLALLLRAMGRSAEAQPLVRQALQITQDTLGPAHPTYAIRLNNLALLLQDMGRSAEAEALYHQALQITKDTLGPAHPDYAIRLNNLALLLQAMGRYAEAEPLFRQALQIGEATLGPAHPAYAAGLNNLAVLFMDKENWAEAEPLMAQALQILEAALPPDHPYVAGSREDLQTIRARLL